jgi:hypothetical protein
MGLELRLAQETPDGVARDAFDDALRARRRCQRGMGTMAERPAVSLGGSGANAMIPQICSGWNVYGVPRARSIAQALGDRPSFVGAPAFAPVLHGRA